MRDPEWIEAERQTADRRGVVPLGESESKHMAGKRAQRKRRQEHDVVRRHRACADPLKWRGNQAQAEPMIRQRQHPGGRNKREAVPPALRQRQHVRVPPENRRAEQRVAEIGGDDGGQMQNQRKRQRDRERRIQQPRDEKRLRPA